MQQTTTVVANQNNDQKYYTSGMTNDKDKKNKDREFQESAGNNEPKIEYFTE